MTDEPKPHRFGCDPDWSTEPQSPTTADAASMAFTGPSFTEFAKAAWGQALLPWQVDLIRRTEEMRAEGFDFAELYQQRPTPRDVPVVLHTGYDVGRAQFDLMAKGFATWETVVDARPRPDHYTPPPGYKIEGKRADRIIIDDPWAEISPEQMERYKAAIRDAYDRAALRVLGGENYTASATVEPVGTGLEIEFMPASTDALSATQALIDALQSDAAKRWGINPDQIVMADSAVKQTKAEMLAQRHVIHPGEVDPDAEFTSANPNRHQRRRAAARNRRK